MNRTGRGSLPALVFLFVLLALWQLGAMQVNAAYILPTPVQILRRLWELRGPLFTVHLPATMAVTGLGLAISLVLGLGLAAAMDWSPLLQRCLYPVVVASQTIPTTAIAPLFVLWFGYGVWSKVLVSVLMTFFPITITVYDGLRSARAEMAELLETYGRLSCSKADLSRVDPGLIVGKREGDYGCQALINDRAAFQRAYPDLSLEAPTLEDLMIFTTRGDSLSFEKESEQRKL